MTFYTKRMLMYRFSTFRAQMPPKTFSSGYHSESHELICTICTLNPDTAGKLYGPECFNFQTKITFETRIIFQYKKLNITFASQIMT